VYIYCRYFAIKHPLRRFSWIGFYGNQVLIIIWIFGIIISLPQLFASRIVSFEYGGNKYLDCRDEWHDKYNEKVWNLFYFWNIMKFLQTFSITGVFVDYICVNICVSNNYSNIHLWLNWYCFEKTHNSGKR
jgi:hypothetical protein